MLIIVRRLSSFPIPPCEKCFWPLVTCTSCALRLLLFSPPPLSLSFLLVPLTLLFLLLQTTLSRLSLSAFRTSSFLFLSRSRLTFLYAFLTSSSMEDPYVSNNDERRSSDAFNFPSEDLVIIDAFPSGDGTKVGAIRHGFTGTAGTGTGTGGELPPSLAPLIESTMFDFLTEIHTARPLSPSLYAITIMTRIPCSIEMDMEAQHLL
mmetsp:Transcript_37438/g.78971  ORF Transcript_37438/g.78971 Transcript_37438/m.78971 type:complete len:206 (+) Transcript_37438:2264-2881(+)